MDDRDSIPNRGRDFSLRHRVQTDSGTHPASYKSRDNSVSIALGYGLDNRGSRVRFSAGAWNFSFHHRVQNGSVAHSAFYPMCTGGSFPGVRRPVCEPDHLNPSSAEVKTV
jgi:hypothetical protein